jgi:phosphoribosylanthranilate isomerase
MGGRRERGPAVTLDRVRVKICGVTREDAIDAAAEAGADAVGFVFAESPRRVSVSRALELSLRVPPFVARVAVFRHPSERDVREVRERLAPAWVQSDFEDRGIVATAAGSAFVPVLRDGPCLEDDLGRLLGEAKAPRPVVLFESVVSGAGRVADWSRAAALAGRTRLVLAGGLSERNVEDAILRVRPWAVDVSTGVEAEPGRKDPARIAAFVAAVRRGERRLEGDR